MSETGKSSKKSSTTGGHHNSQMAGAEAEGGASKSPKNGSTPPNIEDVNVYDSAKRRVICGEVVKVADFKQLTPYRCELVVGGEFVRLFIANPGWVLRKPKEFLTELLELWSKLVATPNPDGEKLETVTTAVVCLFSSNSSLLDQVPSLGHVPKVFIAMKVKNTAFPKSAIQVCHQLAGSEICIRAMTQVDSVGPIQTAMKIRRDSIALAAEALSKMFDKGEEELISQALRTELVQYLLKLLEAGLEAIDNPASTKAQIVKAIKSMQRSLLYAEQIDAILNVSTTWKDYKDQRHDLFISNTEIAGYLTGPTGPNVAGYLTAGTRSTMPDKPPPLDHHDDQH